MDLRLYCGDAVEMAVSYLACGRRGVPACDNSARRRVQRGRVPLAHARNLAFAEPYRKLVARNRVLLQRINYTARICVKITDLHHRLLD